MSDRNGQAVPIPNFGCNDFPDGGIVTGTNAYEGTWVRVRVRGATSKVIACDRPLWWRRGDVLKEQHEQAVTRRNRTEFVRASGLGIGIGVGLGVSLAAFSLAPTLGWVYLAGIAALVVWRVFRGITKED